MEKATKTATKRGLPAKKLPELLKSMTQGDLLTLGAVTIVGRGTTPVVHAAGKDPAANAMWAVTVDSALGWYVIISGPCEVVRDPLIEPCLLVAPVATVSKERYQQLRSGEYSPREFPLPSKEVAKLVGADHPDDFWPVADVRYVTSVDKSALLNDEVTCRRPLTGPQQKRLSLWLGRRFNRGTHSDQLETHVLHKAGEKVSKLAAEVARVSKLSEASAEARFVGATREWLIGGNERAVQIVAVVDAGSTKLMGLYNNALSEIDGKALAAAGARLAKVLQGTLVADSGYSISVRSVTLDGITAADYLSVEPWMWADVSDPLGDLAAGV